MRTSLVGISLVVAVLVSGCGSSATSSAGPTFTPAPTATNAPTATPAPTAPPAPTAKPTAKPTAILTPTPTATTSIAWVEIQPEAAIDISGVGVHPALTDGKALWVVAPNALLKIDPKTNDVVSLDAPVMPDDTTLALADDGLWVARWGSNKLYRLDPKTAEVQLESTVTTPVNIRFVGDDMWIGQESLHAMFKVDRLTGEIDPTSQVDGSAYAAPGLGDFWFMDHGQVKRVDPQTGEMKGMIDLAGKANCVRDLGGTFPDSVWTGCFEREAHELSIARIDPATNTVAQILTLPPSAGGPLVEIGDHTWYLGTFKDADQNDFAGFVRIDLATGAMDRFYSIPGVDPDQPVTLGDALWIPDEHGRLLKVDLADFEA